MLWENLIAAFQYLKGASEKGEPLFTWPDDDGTREYSFKLKEERFILDVRKKFFTQRVVKHWNILPRETVDGPFLEVFKTTLNGSLSNLI